MSDVPDNPYTTPEAEVAADKKPFRWWLHVLLLVVLPPVLGTIVTIGLLTAAFTHVTTVPPNQKTAVLTESISSAMLGTQIGLIAGAVGLGVTVFRWWRHQIRRTR